MQVVRLATFTAAGTAAGFATSGLGAFVIHPGSQHRHDVLNDALVGAVGGASINAIAGLVAALSPPVSFRHNLAEVATSTLLVGGLGGVVGSLIMAATGDAAHVDVRHELAAGAVGTLAAAVVGTAAWAGLCGCRLALCCFPRAEHRVARLQEALLGHAAGSVDDLAQP